MLSQYSQDNIAQVKALSNIVLEAQDNNAQEKNPVQSRLNTFGDNITQVKTL